MNGLKNVGDADGHLQRRPTRTSTPTTLRCSSPAISNAQLLIEVRYASAFVQHRRGHDDARLRRAVTAARCQHRCQLRDTGYHLRASDRRQLRSVGALLRQPSRPAGLRVPPRSERRPLPRLATPSGFPDGMGWDADGDRHVVERHFRAREGASGMGIAAGNARVITPAGAARTSTTAYTLCATTNSWRALSNSLPAGRVDPVGGLVGSGAGARIVVAGGRDDRQRHLRPRCGDDLSVAGPRQCQRQPQLGRGQLHGRLSVGAPPTRSTAATCLLSVALTTAAASASGERFDDSLLTWSAIAAMPAAVCQARAVISGQYIIVRWHDRALDQLDERLRPVRQHQPPMCTTRP